MDDVDEHFIRTINLNVAESNKAESQVAKQVILVAAAALAVLGSLSPVTDTGFKPRELIIVLLTLATIALTVSILSGIANFCIEFLFWQGGVERLTRAREETRGLPKPERAAAFNAITSTSNDKSNRLLFWIQIYSFAVSVLLLACLILIRIYSGSVSQS